jgi:hypothetical protein
MNPLQEAASTTLQNLSAPTEGSFSVTPDPVYPVDDATLFAQKQAREAKTSTWDYARAAVSQNDFFLGMIRSHVGDQMAPDENYVVTEAKGWKELTEGVPEEYHNEFYKAKSGAHAQYIKGNILEKIQEQQQLGDLGGWGRAGVFAGSLVMPGNLAVMALTMGAGSVVGGSATLTRAVTAHRVATQMAPGAARNAALLKATAQMERAEAALSGAKAVATDVVVGAGSNVGIEMLRQKHNFEDSNAGLVEAGLMGLAFALPIGAVQARHMAKLRNDSAIEKGFLEVMQRQEATPHIPLTPEETSVVRRYEKLVKQIREIDADPTGNLNADNDFTVTPEYKAWLNSVEQGKATKEAADSILDDIFPKRGEEPPPVKMTLKEQMLERKMAAEDVAKWDAENRDLLGDVKGRNDAPPPVAEELDRLGFKSDVLLAKADTRQPDLFGPMSVGAAQLGGAAPAVGIDPVYRPINGRLRIDYSATLNGQPNKVLQEFAWLAVKDAIGNGSAQRASASEIKRTYQRTLGGNFHAESRGAYNEAVKTLGLTLKERFSYHQKFYEDVARIARGDESVIDPRIESQQRRAAASMTKVYKTMLDEMQKHGVEGASEIQPNDFYVNRIWRSDNIKRLMKTHSEDEVYQLVADAMLTKVSVSAAGVTAHSRPGIATAKSFVNAVMKLEYSHLSTDIHLVGRDMGMLRSELARAGLQPGEINAIVDTLFEHKAGSEADAGRPTNLKFRFQLNENHSMKMANGETVRLSDLFENDSRVLVDRYLGSMGGHTAFAQHGITSRSAFEELMRKAEAEHAGDQMNRDTAEYTNATQMARDIYDNVTGRPMSMQTFNRADRIMAGLRAYTRSAVLGQLGIAAAFELKNTFAIAGMNAMLTQMPTFRKTLAAFKNGYGASDELGRTIRDVWGFGTEHAAAYARQSEFSDFAYERALTKWEDFGNKASHVVDTVSGNRYVTAATREWTARSVIQKYADFAVNRGKLNASQRKRLIANGMAEGLIDDTLDMLKKHTKRDGKRVSEIDWEAWQAEDPHTAQEFHIAVERTVRDAIQDHDLGETMPFMHSTVGKIFSELRTFNLAAHSKQFLKNVHHWDAQAFTTFTYGFVGESLAYAMQTSLNFAHDPAELEKRLSPERIARAAIARMSALGVIPFIADAGMQVATGQPLSTGTANTGNRNPFVPPSLMVAGRLGAGITNLGSALNPLSDGTTTRREVKDGLSSLPLGNTWFIRNGIDMFSQQFPKSEPAR